VFRAGTTFPASSAPLAPGPYSDEKSHREPAALIRRSLRLCTAEGIAAEVVTACAGGAVLTGWALHLGCGPLLTGVVVALPQMAQLVQLPAAWITSLFGHRRAALWMVALSRQALLPLVALPFLPIADGAKQTVLLAVAALSATLSVMGNNAWTAWMGELVPRGIRGRFFGRRTAVCVLGGALASWVAGAFLDRLRASGHPGTAFAALALVACAAGAVTTWLMRQQHDPAPHASRAPFDLRYALRPFRDRSYRAVLAYQVTWNAAVGLASSYFAIHMLENLRMGFTLIALHGTCVAALRMLVAPMWGRAIDRLGARPVLLTCSFGVSIIPLLWLFPTPDFLWPIVVDVALSGLFWGGHGIATFALPLAVAPREGRPFYLAAFAMAGGVAFSASTAAAGALAEWLPRTLTIAGRPYANLQVLFAMTSAARVFAALYAARIAEPGARTLPEALRQLPVLEPLRARFAALQAVRR
jgi:MFS family permease